MLKSTYCHNAERNVWMIQPNFGYPSWLCSWQFLSKSAARKKMKKYRPGMTADELKRA